MPNNATGWVWWIFSVIVANFAINLASSYTKPFIDQLWGRFSERRRIKNAKAQEKFNRQLEKMLADPIEVLLVEQARNHALTHILLGLILLLDALWVVTNTHGNELFALVICIPAVVTVIATRMSQSRQDYVALIRQYRKLEAQHEQEQANK